MLANDYASDCNDSQYELWYRISKDEYMAYAVKECYYSTERILHSLVDAEGQRWYAFSKNEDESDTSIKATQCLLLFCHLTVMRAADIYTGLKGFSAILMKV